MILDLLLDSLFYHPLRWQVGGGKSYGGPNFNKNNSSPTLHFLFERVPLPFTKELKMYV